MTTAKVTQLSGEILFEKDSSPNAKVSSVSGEILFSPSIVPNAQVSSISAEVLYNKNTAPKAKITGLIAEILFVEAVVAIGPEVLIEFFGADAAEVTTDSFNDAYGPEVLIDFFAPVTFTVTPDIEGVIFDEFFGSNFFLHISEALDSYEVDYFPYHEDVTNDLLHGALTYNQPSEEILADPITGVISEFFLGDFYNRIHIFPSPLAMGNVFSEVVKGFAVWNSFLTNQTLNSVSAINATGLVLDPLIPSPITLTPLEEKVFEITASQSGPANINATYTFNFASGSVELTVSGSRVVVIQYPYLYEFTEAREWLTDIITTPDTEESLFIREIPRTTYSVKCLLPDHNELTRARSMFEKLEPEYMALPIWENVFQKKNLEAGTTVIAVDTSILELTAGDNMIIRGGLNNYEIVTIDSFDSSSITLLAPVGTTYSMCYIAPVKIGKIVGGVNVTKNNKRISLEFNFLVFDSFTLADWPDMETYQDKPVIANKRPMITGLNEKLERRVDNFDNKTGITTNYSLENKTKLNDVLTLAAHSKIEKYYVKRKLDYLKGKYVSFWFASATEDILPAGDIPPGGDTLEIYSVNWSIYNPKHLRITGKDINGNTLIKNLEILSVSQDLIYSNIERVKFTEVLASGLYNIAKIEILRKVRLNSDRHEFQHITKDTMLVSIPIIETNV